MDAQQFDPALFRETLRSLKAPTLAMLIDHVDSGIPFAAMNTWSRAALERRGILRSFLYALDCARKTGSTPFQCDTLTPYGAAFVAWYREGQNLDTQMSLFSSED